MDTTLRCIRRGKNLTQEQLAVLSGVSLAAIKDIERGERGDVKVGTMLKLAKALDVSLTDLIPSNYFF